MLISIASLKIFNHLFPDILSEPLFVEFNRADNQSVIGPFRAVLLDDAKKATVVSGVSDETVSGGTAARPRFET